MAGNARLLQKPLACPLGFLDFGARRSAASTGCREQGLKEGDAGKCSLFSAYPVLALEAAGESPCFFIMFAYQNSYQNNIPEDSVNIKTRKSFYKIT